MKKYEFKLNTDQELVKKKYKIDKLTSEHMFKNSDDSQLKHGTTLIKDLDEDKTSSISFLDDSKKNVVCSASVSNLSVTKRDISDCCFWCRHPFESVPIGCPVRYIPRQAVKKFRSNISKDMYIIKENVTQMRAEDIEENDTLKCQESDFYETDGIFCSFNCCQAYINDNKHNRYYDQSSMLLMKIYRQCVPENTKITKILPAPHWRMLKTYGGTLDIFEYRSSFNKVEYEPQGSVTPRPNFIPITKLFQEKFRF